MGTSSLRRAGVFVAATTVVALAATSSAQAVHWPFFGGDNGRSGYQPVDEGGAPVRFLYKKDATAEQFVKTSIVTTTGPPTAAATAARFAYGTRDGRVQIRRLLDGAPVGPAGGVSVSADADAFGTRSTTPGENGSSVSFADTSGATGLGQLFVAHNDDDTAAGAADIEIAQFDEATGDLVQQIDVQGTDGFTIQSSLLATGPAVDDAATTADETGNRVLFFVASNGATQALFRVVVTGNASTRTAMINGAAATRTVADIDATPLASPTLVFLTNAIGTPVAHVAVGTNTGISTFTAGALAAGPTVVLGGPTQTPSVPVQPSGMTPNPGVGNALTSAPVIYVAADTGTTTTTYKIAGNASALTVQQMSLPLPGDPAPALATDQEAEADIAEAKVFLTTSNNLYLLTTADLSRAGQFDKEDDLAGGSTGFQQTTAAGSGDFVYVTNDQAEQFVLRLSDGKRVGAADFTADAGATALANTGVGQPSLSRGFVQYSGGRGAFVYRNADAIDPTVALTAPAADASLDGTVTFAATAFDARGIASVTFRLNGLPVGTATEPTGSPFGAPGAAYSVMVDTAGLPSGSYLVDAVATDGSGRTTVSAQRRVSLRLAAGGDDGPPTVAFTNLAEGAIITGATAVNLAAADDRGVAKVELFNGSRLVCSDTTAPYSCTFSPTGADVGRTTLFAVATDGSGQTASTTRSVNVARFTPTSLSARVSPARDRKAPYRFTARGRLGLPAGVTAAQGCGKGVVSTQVKVGSRTISTRRATLRRDCSYSSTVSFSSRARLGRSGRLKVTVRFLGNEVLGLRTASSRIVRAG